MKAAVLLLVALVPSFVLAVEPKPLNGLALVKAIALNVRVSRIGVATSGTAAQIASAKAKHIETVDAMLAAENGKPVIFEFLVEDVTAEGAIKVTLKDLPKPDPRKPVPPVPAGAFYEPPYFATTIPAAKHGLTKAEYEAIDKGNTLTLTGNLLATKIHRQAEAIFVSGFSGKDNGTSVSFYVTSPKVKISRTPR